MRMVSMVKRFTEVHRDDAECVTAVFLSAMSIKADGAVQCVVEKVRMFRFEM